MHNAKSISGFTLIEILISIGILALISTVVAQVFFTVLRSNTSTENLKDVKQSGEQAMLTMIRMIQNAQEITSSCSVGTTQSSTITIVNPDGGATTFGCVLKDTVTRIASSGATTAYLTETHVTIGGDACAASSLAFSCTTYSGSPSQVGISFSLAQAGTSISQFNTTSKFFQSSAIVRNERQ